MSVMDADGQVGGAAVATIDTRPAHAHLIRELVAQAPPCVLVGPVVDDDRPRHQAPAVEDRPDRLENHGGVVPMKDVDGELR